MRIAWYRFTHDLWVSGRWGETTLSLRIVDVATGALRVPAPPILFSNSIGPDFDISRDGRTVVFARQDLRGDLWTQDVSPARR